jgi:PPM family protein phosphatase
VTIKIQSTFFSIAGIGKTNEDSWDCRTLADGTCIAVIADGVGGNYGGSIASSLAVKVAIATLEMNSATPLDDVFSTISRTIQERGNEDLISSQMATTLSLCVFHINGTVSIGHVGDSRIYHLRGNGIIQKTKDQTEVAALVDAGILSREQAKTYPRRTVLRSALTAKGRFEFFKDEFLVNVGDRVILMTDGIYRLITKTHLRNLSLQSKTVDNLSYALNQEIANKNDDDATGVFLEISAG